MERTVAIIKPDWLLLKVKRSPFSSVFEKKVHEQGLKIVDCFDISIDENWLRKIFPAINVIWNYWNKRNSEFIKIMKNKPLKTYIIEWENSKETLHEIKKNLRKKYMIKQDLYSKMISNLLHSTDVEDLKITLKAIQKYKILT